LQDMVLLYLVLLVSLYGLVMDKKWFNTDINFQILL
jgi:hypothetical protein